MDESGQQTPLRTSLATTCSSSKCSPPPAVPSSQRYASILSSLSRYVCVGFSITLLNTVLVRILQIRLQTSSGGSIASVLASIVKTTGVRGLWAGCSTALIQSVPNVAVYMVTYENLSTYLTQRASHGTASLVPVVAGSLARFICVTIISPIERIRTIQSSGSSGSMHSIGSSIVSAEGVAGLYKGWPSMILRDVPFSALYWLCYENCKIHLSDLHRSIWDDHSLAGTVSPIGALLAGYLADYLDCKHD